MFNTGNVIGKGNMFVVWLDINVMHISQIFVRWYFGSRKRPAVIAKYSYLR